MLPSLTTDRLVLMPASRADTGELWSIWRQPPVRRYLFDDIELTREQAEETIAEWAARNGEGYGLWTCGLAAGGVSDTTPIIGCAGLMPVTVAARCEPRLAGLAEPLVALAPEHWKRGYAAEALAAVLEHAFVTLGHDVVAGVTDVPNVASHRMLLRAGFEVLGETDGPRWRLRSYRLARSGHTA